MTPEPEHPKGLSPIRLAGLSLALAGVGYLLIAEGMGALRKWDAISGSYAACVLLWVGAGAAMIAGGIWTSISRGRHRIPIWLASRAAVVAGASIIAGWITSVIPCPTGG